MQRLKTIWGKISRNSPLWFIMRILDRLPVLHMKLRIFYFFRFLGTDESVLRPRFQGEIKWGESEDLAGVIKLAGISKSSLYHQRVNNGDKFVTAIDTDGETVGYGWVCLKNTHIENKTGHKFTFPEGAIYAYSIYVNPDYRLHGIWVGFMQLILNSPYYDPERGLYCFINYGNIASLKPHFRYGFHIFSRKIILNFFGRSFAFDKSIVESPQVINNLLDEGH